MRFRLGYVAMTMNLEDCSPSSTVTFNSYCKLPDEEARLYRLRKLTKKNLENTLRILRYNNAMNIKVYRLTSKLVPLATHPATQGWDYICEFKDEFKRIGDYVKENGFRISAHPDHYTLINSSSEKVMEDSLRDLEYHVKMYEAMGLDDYKYKLVMHIGGMYKDKQTSVKRFKDSFEKLPDRIRKRLVLENDDKSYSALDVLEICEELKTPMVIDIHHHKCINSGGNFADLLSRIFGTWENEYFNPKVHFSSPKSDKEFRSHSDYIDVNDFTNFLDNVKVLGKDFDIMLEVKAKDSALLHLSKELSNAPSLKRINEGEFEIFM